MDHGGEAGPFEVRHLSLDDSTRAAGGWDPGKTAENARRAVVDGSAVAYIGEFDSSASEISIPILNAGFPVHTEQGSLLAISPSATNNGLTTNEPGSVPGAPDKFYPTGRRSFARLAPRDTYEGAALAQLMGARGCRRVALVRASDFRSTSSGEARSLYAQGVAHGLKRFRRRFGLRLVSRRRMRPKSRNYRRLALAIKRRRPRCIAFAGSVGDNAAQLFRDLGRRMPHARFYGASGVATKAFTDPRRGGIPRRAARRTLLVKPTLPPSQYPPAGRDVFRRYSATYGDPDPDPYAVYGYEAMDLILDTIERLGTSGNSRSGVRSAVLAASGRAGAIGTYSFDSRGDISLADYGAYRIRRRGNLGFVTVVRPRG